MVAEKEEENTDQKILGGVPNSFAENIGPSIFHLTKKTDVLV